MGSALFAMTSAPVVGGAWWWSVVVVHRTSMLCSYELHEVVLLVAIDRHYRYGATNIERVGANVADVRFVRRFNRPMAKYPGKAHFAVWFASRPACVQKRLAGLPNIVEGLFGFFFTPMCRSRQGNLWVVWINQVWKSSTLMSVG
ncbi:uncharacterized protein CC84DRAFT_882114 [Paraphaeosphaeria sporulosa]|uniref:Uncharacterized protein n=1 Tax=Paraphaeosphaeria sporulosa TaxID=1460663 RepID=A0A177CB69_9PLEO|nr:uncharacterized protein CC84DRAFT_882114 [Paraphaeosphaeria sporulosa]OAG04018.1 hypothetical protein CC84DRAFT_882114 [Paraphaeosphaeria sporulosa]